MAKIAALSAWPRELTLSASTFRTPELIIQSRPLLARQARQIGRVQRWLRYSGMLTPQNTAIVPAASGAGLSVARAMARPLA